MFKKMLGIFLVLFGKKPVVKAPEKSPVENQAPVPTKRVPEVVVVRKAKTEDKNKMKFKNGKCHKCGGTGKVPFKKNDGKCFNCDGTGICPWTYENDKVAVWKAGWDWYVQSKASQHWVKIDPDNGVSWSEGFPEEKKVPAAEFAKKALGWI